MASDLKDHVFLLKQNVDSLHETCMLISNNGTDRNYSSHVDTIIKAIEQVHLMQEKIISDELELFETATEHVVSINYLMPFSVNGIVC